MLVMMGKLMRMNDDPETPGDFILNMLKFLSFVMIIPILTVSLIVGGTMSWIADGFIIILLVRILIVLESKS